MNNSIKKSLINKDIESFTYNPQIVVNKRNKNIKSKLEYYLKRSDRFDIAVSYVVWSGLQLIYDSFKKYDQDSRFILTTEGLVTDPRSLRALMDLDVSVKIFDPFVNGDGFHLKSYSFERNNKTTLLVGSSNISSRAFGKVHEMLIEVEAENEGQLVDEYTNSFENLWNSKSAVPLTKEFIEQYTEVYNYKRQMEEYYLENNLQDNKIQPNFMQVEALQKLNEAREDTNRGLVIAATGTGKTYLSAFDVKQTNSKKVLFLVHNRLILKDAITTFRRVFGKDKTIIELKSNNIDRINDADFIFTTDKTAYTHLYKKVSDDYFDYIIYDEAHRIGGKTLYNEIIKYFKPNFTLGMTATPERTDNPRQLFETFKYSVPYEIRLLDSLEHELICPFTYYGLNLDEKLLDINQKFNYYELSKYIKKIINEKGHYGDKLKALLFAHNINEAKDLAEELTLRGFNAVAATSKTATQEEIEDYITSLQSDKEDTIEIICTVNQFNEGVDIPDVNVIIMLRNTVSSIIYLQQLGRGLRRTSDPHKFVTVFDIIGNSKNNYTIAEVLTGNETRDKRELYKQVNTNFESVSPFINVEIEKQAMENVIKSITNNFKVETEIKKKFKEELTRFQIIPDLKDLYNNPNFNELELLQLLFKDLYTPLEDFYKEKYNIEKRNLFLRNFFRLITQFVFRGYDKKTLNDYIDLLKNGKTNNETIKKVLLPKDFDGYSTAINSNYFKASNNFVIPFKKEGDDIKLTAEIINELKENNAYELFIEHIELFEEVAKRDNYKMETFDLVDKGEFLFNVGAKDCYMNVVGERIDHEKKTVYCPITITKGESSYDNYIVDDNKVIYYTQWSSGKNAKQKAEDKIRKFVEENYKFYICAKFPHLGYSNTSYFDLGTVKINKISEIKTDGKGRYNHEIEFKLKEEIPKELLMYK